MNLYLVVKNNVVMACNTKKEAEKLGAEIITVTSIKAARDVISQAMLLGQPAESAEPEQETEQPQEQEQQETEQQAEQIGIEIPAELGVMNSDIHYFKDQDGKQKIRNIVKNGEAKAVCFASEKQMIEAGWGIMPIDQQYGGMVALNGSTTFVSMARTTTYRIVGKVGDIEYAWDTTQALPVMDIKKDSKWWDNRAKISVKARAYIVGLMNIMKRCSMSYKQCMLLNEDSSAKSQEPKRGKLTEKAHWDLENGVWMSWLPSSHYIKGEVDEVPFIWDISKYDSPATVNYAGKGGKVKSKFQHSMAERIVARLRSAGVVISDGWLVA